MVVNEAYVCCDYLADVVGVVYFLPNLQETNHSHVAHRCSTNPRSRVTCAASCGHPCLRP